jgi:hypothetical protein
MKSIGVCGECKHRGPDGVCSNGEKLYENDFMEDPNGDSLVYPYREGGYFKVGKDFGCVHWAAKEMISAQKVNEFLGEVYNDPEIKMESLTFGYCALIIKWKE